MGGLTVKGHERTSGGNGMLYILIVVIKLMPVFVKIHHQT